MSHLQLYTIFHMFLLQQYYIFPKIHKYIHIIVRQNITHIVIYLYSYKYICAHMRYKISGRLTIWAEHDCRRHQYRISNSD